MVTRKGNTILEVIIAIAIFSIVFVSLTSLYLGSYGSNLRDSERFQADMYMQQAFEATRSMRDYNFSSLTNGTHGLSNSSGYWQFSGTSDTLGQFTRSMVISEIRRDTNCGLVESGGTIDPNSKKAVVTITWDLVEGDETVISSTQYLNDWTVSTGCSLADDLSIDIGGVYYSHNDKRVKGITLENTGSTDLVIETITVSWIGAPGTRDIIRIKIGGTTLWTGNEQSGATIDIIDTTLTAGAGTYSTVFRFNKWMTGTTYTLTFNLSDGSSASATVNP